METTDQRFKRLPKWAQQEFIALLNHRDDLRSKVLAVSGGRATNIEVDQSATRRGEGSMFLPNTATVRFQLPSGWVDARLCLPKPGRMGTYLELTSSGFAGNEMYVRPWVTNQIRVELKP